MLFQGGRALCANAPGRRTFRRSALTEHCGARPRDNIMMALGDAKKMTEEIAKGL
jgi:hypothetical protein